MVKSMTGYGKALSASENMDVSVEIKSVNSRYLDFSPKTPRALNAFDDELSKLIKQACVRGRVTLMCSIDYHESTNSGLTLNLDKIREYIKVADEIQLELNSNIPVTVDQLMKSQDIYISNDKDDLSEELKSTFFNAVNGAIKQLDQIRNAEGKNLKKDLETRLKNVETYVSQIESKSSKQRSADFKRYKNRISELLEDVSLDEQRLLQEVAIIAEKKDISEEIVRLGSHIQLYNTYFDDAEYAGRKMNFMLQEMGREVNTIGSKTDQIEVSHLVVSVKDELEKMREQVQNII